MDVARTRRGRSLAPLVAGAALLLAPGAGLARSGALRVDLARAVRLALAENPDVRASAHAVSATRALTDQARAARWPSLHAVAGWTEYRRGQRLFPPQGPGAPALITHNLVSGDLALTFPLFTGFEQRSTVRAAEAAEKGARHASARTRALIRYQVTAVFFAILAQRELCAALKTSEAALRDHVRRLDALVREGKAAPLDRQRIEVRLALLKQDRIQAHNALDVQQRTLASLMGQQARAIEVVGSLAAPGGRPQPESAAVKLALSRRPDYRGARAEVDVQASRVEAARAGHWPRIFVQGSYGLRWGPWPAEAPEGADSVADVGQLGLVLDLPLFEGGRVSAKIRERRALLAIAQQRLRRLELQIRLEVERAVRDLRTAAKRVEVLKLAVAQAERAFNVETEKQAAGKGTVSDVLSAQAEHVTARATLARALADANVAGAALALAIGAGEAKR